MLKGFRLLWLVLGLTPALAQEEQAALAVSLLSAQEESVARRLFAEGEVTAREMAAVNAQVAGVALLALHADVGDRVQKDEVLAEFDREGLTLELAQAEAALARSEATFALAEGNAARARRLSKDKAMSQMDADQLLNAEREARAALSGARAARDLAALRLQHAQVRAPANGVVVTRSAELGMMAGVGTPLFALMVDGALEWRAQVAPQEMARLSLGTAVEVMVGEERVGGRVTKFAPVADVQSRQVTVYVALPREAALRAGMFVRGAFLLGEETVQTVPASAVVREDGYDWLVLVDEQLRAHRQAVTLGDRLGARVVVREGLPAGARFVARGGSFLQDGDGVRVVEP